MLKCSCVISHFFLVVLPLDPKAVLFFGGGAAVVKSSVKGRFSLAETVLAVDSCRVAHGVSAEQCVATWLRALLPYVRFAEYFADAMMVAGEVVEI